MVQATQYKKLISEAMHFSDFERHENLPSEPCHMLLGVDQTVHDIKKKVESKLGVPLANQELHWSGKVLNDHATLKTCGFDPWTNNAVRLKWTENVQNRHVKMLVKLLCTDIDVCLLQIYRYSFALRTGKNQVKCSQDGRVLNAMELNLDLVILVHNNNYC